MLARPATSHFLPLQVEPECTAHITPGGDVRIEISKERLGGKAATTELDPVQLAIFSHR
jgi:hypothetical protein